MAMEDCKLFRYKSGRRKVQCYNMKQRRFIKKLKLDEDDTKAITINGVSDGTWLILFVTDMYVAYY